MLFAGGAYGALLRSALQHNHMGPIIDAIPLRREVLVLDVNQYQRAISIVDDFNRQRFPNGMIQAWTGLQEQVDQLCFHEAAEYAEISWRLSDVLENTMRSISLGVLLSVAILFINSSVSEQGCII